MFTQAAQYVGHEGVWWLVHGGRAKGHFRGCLGSGLRPPWRVLRKGPWRGLDRRELTWSNRKALIKVNPVGRWMRVQGRCLVNGYGGCLLDGHGVMNSGVDQLRFLKFSARRASAEPLRSRTADSRTEVNP